MTPETAKTILIICGWMLGNAASLIAIGVFYAKLIHRQAKIEFLIKRLCDKVGVSTDVAL